MGKASVLKCTAFGILMFILGAAAVTYIPVDIRQLVASEDEDFLVERLGHNVRPIFFYVETAKPGWTGGGFASYGAMVDGLSTETLVNNGWEYEGETSYSIAMSLTFERLFPQPRSKYYLKHFPNDIAILYIIPLSESRSCIFYSSHYVKRD